jgi:broad specificity phosphatase PhoE
VEIALIRHAEPAWSRGGRSVADPDLTERGERQAAATARRLADEDPYDELLVSPARRAVDTARVIAGHLGLDPEVLDGFEEIRGPIVDGLPSAEVEKMFRDAHHRPLEEWWNGFGGAEPFRDFHGRVVTTLEKVLADRGVTPLVDDPLWALDGEDRRRLLVVAHGGTNAVIIAHLLRLEPTPWEWERFVANHASVSRLALRSLAGAHIFALRSSNGVEHLVPADRTR